MVSFFSYGHVVKQHLKSSENVKNREFSSASVMFRVTFEYDNLVSGNDEHRFIRLLDELNHVAGSIFSYGHVFYPLHRASEMLSNALKCAEML